MADADHPILIYANAAKRGMLARDRALMRRITMQYARRVVRLKQAIAALESAAQSAQGAVSLAQLPALRVLLEQAEREFGEFGIELSGILVDAANLEIDIAATDAHEMVRLGLGALTDEQFSALWQSFDGRPLRTMFGFLDPAGPMHAQLRNQFGRAVADKIRTALLAGFADGKHPLAIAAMVRREAGVGLTWAMSSARTMTAWAYRATSHASYRQNRSLVKGWYWQAALDERVCMSCIAMHGSLHGVDEILNDHHQGRCAAVPQVASYADLGFDIEDAPLRIESGLVWFGKLTAEQQQQMMGMARWRAWQAGEFTFDQLSRVYSNPVYGLMRREASLNELVADSDKYR